MKAGGYILATASGASFGLLPLFTIPLLAAGMDSGSIIVYRFFAGALAMLAVLLYRQNSLRITWGDAWRIALLAFSYVVCAITLFISYAYISSGFATALVYTNPVWCALIGLLFLGERLTWRLVISLLLAVAGVTLLSGVLTTPQTFSLLGLSLGALSGFGYGVYLIALPRLRIAKMPSLKLTFYIFLFAAVIMLAWQVVAGGGVDTVPSTDAWINIALLGLLPTAFSNISLTMALKRIDTTIVAILGAFEPLTALVTGIIVFAEPCTAGTISGVLLVLVAVAVLTIKQRSKAA